MDINSVDTLIEEFRNGRKFISRIDIELFIREIVNLRNELERIENFHPIAFKLIMKKKIFLVVAVDEPYFKNVYQMIRAEEINKGSWTDQDEMFFTSSCYYNKNLLESKNHGEN